MAKSKDPQCGTCSSYLNKAGNCLNCHPTGRARKPGNPGHGNSRDKKERRPPAR